MYKCLKKKTREHLLTYLNIKSINELFLALKRRACLCNICASSSKPTRLQERLNTNKLITKSNI